MNFVVKESNYSTIVMSKEFECLSQPLMVEVVKALSHHGVWPERMPTYTQNRSKIVRVQERPTSQRIASEKSTSVLEWTYP